MDKKPFGGLNMVQKMKKIYSWAVMLGPAV
jgi:hypothetical protein